MPHSTYPRLRTPITAYSRRGSVVCLAAGTRVRNVFQAAGQTHFLAMADGHTWNAYYTTEPLDTEPDGAEATG